MKVGEEDYFLMSKPRGTGHFKVRKNITNTYYHESSQGSH